MSANVLVQNMQSESVLVSHTMSTSTFFTQIITESCTYSTLWNTRQSGVNYFSSVKSIEEFRWQFPSHYFSNSLSHVQPKDHCSRVCNSLALPHLICLVQWQWSHDLIHYMGNLVNTKTYVWNHDHQLQNISMDMWHSSCVFANIYLPLSGEWNIEKSYIEWITPEFTKNLTLQTMYRQRVPWNLDKCL